MLPYVLKQRTKTTTSYIYPRIKTTNRWSYRCQQREFDDWISNAKGCGIKEFEKCAKMFRNWRKEILNAFKYGITNGVTEGFNNKIKVLKRSSYGIRSFNRFLTRILHCTS